jgi:riboflavin synthase
VFTGIVEAVGAVRAIDVAVAPRGTRALGAVHVIESAATGGRAGRDGQRVPGARLTIETPLAAELARAESIAVDGVCLTVAEVGDDHFVADVVAETLARSTLAERRPADRVNLERAATLQTRLSGHLLQGHVDGVGTVVDRAPEEGGEVVRIGLPEPLARYVVEKGSVGVDGISLTVVQAGPDSFAIALIPTTLAETTLGNKQPGATVNLEVDVIAKYVERQLGEHARRSGADRPRQAA